LRIQRPPYVVPENVDLAVVGQQFANESMGVFDEALARIFVGCAARTIRMMPIHERVVEADAQPLRPRSFHIFTDEVAAGALFRSAIICQFRVPHAEALMMLRGHHHVLLSRPARQSCPVAGCVRFGCEMLCENFILSNRNAFVLHCPFVLADHTVESPVDEHAEARLMPPLHAARAVSLNLCSFFGMLVRNLGWQSARLTVGVSETGCGDCTGGSESLQKMTA